MNESLRAEGELYVDDGKSFEFEKGAYMHRHFLFADGKLVSSDKALPSLGTRFTSDCVIERIVLLGLPHGSKSALIEPGNHKVDIELGPIRLGGKQSSTALTIRKPNIQVRDDWTIHIL